MAQGQTSSAEQDRPSSAGDAQPFFQTKRAAAALKHSILSGYVVPFVSKTGKFSEGNRVVIVDGYAGAGRYEDGAPGSPALLAEAARHKALQGRQLDCYFVENDEATYGRLCEILTEEEAAGGRITWEARRGSVADHLSDLLNRARGVPLLLFLDPFGLGLPFDTIAEIFAGRPQGPGSPATEVLFRFDAGAIRRIRGALHSEKDYAARDQQLRSLDRAAGGPWWREEDDPGLDNEQYVAWFEEQLLHRICQKAGCLGWSTDVRNKPENKVAYLLLFLTRHRAGLEKYGDTLSRAQGEWRRFVFDKEFATTQADGQGTLLDLDRWFEDTERRLAEGWQNRIEQNVRALLRGHEWFVVRSKFEEVFGGVLGEARETHLRAVLRKLSDEGVTTSNQVGKDLYGKKVVLTPGIQP